MKHALENVFELSAHRILDVIQGNNRCLIAVKGAIAQEHLGRCLHNLRRRGVIRGFESIDKDGQPDFAVVWKGRKYLLECKNVQKSLKNGEMTVDFMRSRFSMTKHPRTRYYSPSEFHVLAACLYNQTKKWEFRFIATNLLRRHPKHRSRFDNKVTLGPSASYHRAWHADLIRALKAAT